MTRRALLLAAALAWPGVAWGQTVTDDLPFACPAGWMFKRNPAHCAPPMPFGETTLEYIRPAIPTYTCPTGQSCSAGRSYTPAEIDRMREAVTRQLTTEEPMRWCVKTDQPGQTSRSFPTCPVGWQDITGKMVVIQSAAAIEDRLRTYIAAGITAEQLEKQ